MTRMKLLATGLVLACAGTASVARAVDREAPGIYSTIDLAIAAAVVGQDRVVIGGDVDGPFTLDKAIEVTLKPGQPARTIEAPSGAQFCARITAAGGKITNLTLRGGSTKVVDVGPGTVQYCRIEDVSGTLQYDPAVVMGSSSGQFLDNTIVRTTSAKCVELSAPVAVTPQPEPRSLFRCGHPARDLSWTSRAPGVAGPASLALVTCGCCCQK